MSAIDDFTRQKDFLICVDSDGCAMEDKKPFPNVKEGLRAAHVFADVAIVADDDREAVLEEWERCALLDDVDVMCCQDVGSKTHCIAELKEKGYADRNFLMVGDAPGDQDAAAKNGVYYYPILVRHEGESWQELIDTALDLWKNGEYAPYGAKKSQEFLENLGG